ncbi:hypothetical protein DXG01_005581 [Tephrocybe rancida]|nr:hypothetical protein DXG01_005581 [Tephrocybe rancida]
MKGVPNYLMYATFMIFVPYMNLNSYEITGDWEEACNSHPATVNDEFFSSPTWKPGQTPPTAAPKKDLESAGLVESLFARALGSFTSKPRRQLHALERRVGECQAFRRPDGVVIYMPNVAAAWGANPQGPAANTIANTPQVQNAFQRFITIDRWIYADPTNLRRIFIRRAARSRSNPLSQNATPGSGTAAIDLNNPEANPGQPAPAGWVIVANFHTHPMGPAYGGNPANPSTADNANAWYRGVPGIIIQWVV